MSTPPLTDFADVVAEHLLNGLILSAAIFDRSRFVNAALFSC